MAKYNRLPPRTKPKATPDPKSTGGPLRQAASNWFRDLLNWITFGWYDRMDARYEELRPLTAQVGQNASTYSMVERWSYGAVALIYTVSGWRAPLDLVLALIFERPEGDLSAQIANFIRDNIDNPLVKELVQVSGTLVTEPVLALFEGYSGRDDVDPKEFARTFHGVMISLTALGGLVGTAVETLSLGQVEGVNQMFTSIYWSLGLGFLGWQTLAPLLSAGLQPGLERYYQKKYRPARFGAPDLRDLFALGKISRAELEEEARLLGWREKDIPFWIELAYRQLNQGEVMEAWHLGLFTEAEATDRLRALGFAPADLPLIFALNPKEDTTEARTTTLSTAKAAFKAGLIPEPEFRQLLAELNYSEREIDLQVQLLRMTQEQDLRTLNVSQIRSALDSKVISEAEARHWLSEQGYAAADIDLLVATWKAELEPPFVRLNRGTIVGAYVEHVLTRAQAAAKLQAVGFAQVDAALELDLAEARNPEKFGREVPPTKKTLTAGALAELLIEDLITPAEMRRRLIEQGVEEVDAQLLVRAALLRKEEEPRPLSQFSVERAYIAGILTRQQAFDHLVAIDFTPEDAALILNTVEEENPAVFDPNSIQVFTLPSAGALVQALADGIIDEIQFFARMLEIGYDRAAADIYKQIALREPPRRDRTLTVAQITEAYARAFIPYGEALARIAAQGYTNQDALLELRLRSNVIKDQEPWKMWLAGRLDPESAIEQLLSMGFTDAEIQEAVQIWEEENARPETTAQPAA